ncbi:MAG TPA: hypothetical protein VMS77_01590, partial [Conexivisphaerales archaeon]|nr:hypothetical protein [Conexivisphaerales archaeon]
MAFVLDSEGNGFFFDYDFDSGKKEAYARVRSSAGRVKEVWFDRDWEVKRVDLNGRTIKKIAKDGRALIITDEAGNITREDYNEWDSLVKTTYPDGTRVTTEYEHTFNKPVARVDERGITTRYEYDTLGNLARKTEASGTADERVTDYAYDSDGNQLSVRVLGDASTQEAVTAMAYDASGNMVSVTDPEGNRTRFTHDVMGNVLTKEDGRGKVSTYGYDLAGRLASVRDPLGSESGIFYDGVGNKVREVDPEGRETTYEYDVRNNLTKRTDALGNATLFTYNPDGKLVKQTDPEGKEVSYGYDLDGRLVATVDGNGNETRMEYDVSLGASCSSCGGNGGSDRPSRIIYPTFTKELRYDVRGRKVQELDLLSATEIYTSTFAYDAVGNLASKTDKEGRVTQYEYDALNRLKRVTDPLNQVTEYTYDDRDNLVALKDAKGNTTAFQYDRNNRLVKETRPMGQVTSYEYDQVGNLARKVDAKQQKTEYGYDDAGRLGRISSYAAAGDSTPVKTVGFTYDNVGSLTSYNDGVTAAAYGYDDLYRKTVETVNYGSFTLGYAYDYYRNGRKKSFTGPDGVAYQYTYDDADQLASVVIPNQGSITMSSHLWNRPLTVILPGGSKREYGYDGLMRTQAITVKDPLQNPLMAYGYTYDRMDNITGKGTEHGAYAYGYDELYRLKNANNPTLPAEGFTYDPVGNRLTAAGVSGSW